MMHKDCRDCDAYKTAMQHSNRVFEVMAPIFTYRPWEPSSGLPNPLMLTHIFKHQKKMHFITYTLAWRT